MPISMHIASLINYKEVIIYQEVKTFHTKKAIHHPSEQWRTWNILHRPGHHHVQPSSTPFGNIPTIILFLLTLSLSLTLSPSFSTVDQLFSLWGELFLCLKFSTPCSNLFLSFWLVLFTNPDCRA